LPKLDSLGHIFVAGLWVYLQPLWCSWF